MKNENDENRYSFTFDTPIETPAVREESREKTHAEMKRYIRRAIALCSVICLLIGGGAGAVIGLVLNKDDGDTAIEDSGFVLKSPQDDADVPDDSGDSAEPDAVKPESNSNLLYTGDSDAEVLSDTDLVKKVENTVVAITVKVETSGQYYFQPYNYVTEASGSGVIVTSDGYIVTNNHVVAGGLSYVVTLADGTTYDAELVGADPDTDIAVLKIDAKGLDYASFGDSDKLEKGEKAVIIGNPLGYLDGSVSVGVISALDRTLNFSDGSTLYSLIQTDAAVNPGNSGGGLFNDRGQLVGIVCAKTSATDVEGLGFAIPVTTAYSVAQDLMSYGYVKGRPALGINTITVSDYMTAMYNKLSYLGVYVQAFIDEEAKKTSGLQIGDYIISIDETTIASTSDIAKVLSEHKVGDTVDVKIYRDGEELTVKTTLVERNADYNS